MLLQVRRKITMEAGGSCDVLQIIFLTAWCHATNVLLACFINRVFIFKSNIYVFEKVWDQSNKQCHYKKRNMNLHFLGLSSFVVGLIDL